MSSRQRHWLPAWLLLKDHCPSPRFALPVVLGVTARRRRSSGSSLKLHWQAGLSGLVLVSSRKASCSSLFPDSSHNHPDNKGWFPSQRAHTRCGHAIDKVLSDDKEWGAVSQSGHFPVLPAVNVQWLVGSSRMRKLLLSRQLG